MRKDKAVHGLHKVPDSELIKTLRYEIGVLTSERDELKDGLKEIKNLEVYRSTLNENKNLKKKLKTAEKLLEPSKLMLKEQGIIIDSLNKRNEFLEKELFKLLKQNI